MRTGIQGLPGSACDEASTLLLPSSDNSFRYFSDANRALEALASGSVDQVILAAESPLGSPVPETAEALARYPSLIVIDELCREVHHCIMVHKDYLGEAIKRVASHPVPLEKHRLCLERHFPGYEAISLADTGLAAQQLADGALAIDTAVIAMPRAAELFGLKVLVKSLPANERYLTRFVVVGSAA
jgi:prephenate dehydratase